MTHLSENSNSLKIRLINAHNGDILSDVVKGFTDVCVIILPPCDTPDECSNPLLNIGTLIADAANALSNNAVLITVGEVIDLVHVQAVMSSSVRYQHWIAIKRVSVAPTSKHALPNHHFGALIHTKYKQSLRHAKTRLKYTYCPACHKTTKDYGGKKHTYHHYGTLISDVWRDNPCDLDKDLSPIINRFQDLFGIEPYKELLILDCRDMGLHRATLGYSPMIDWNKSFVGSREDSPEYIASLPVAQTSFLHYSVCEQLNKNQGEIEENNLPADVIDKVLHGDCTEKLGELPTDSVDFIFTDPPYNLGKKYSGYSDDLEIRDYFNWCDSWLAELTRVLKPGRTLAILNIPLWAVRHFLFMETVLQFQNWIVWDALAFPVRLIMPAHYTILAFSKGQPRELPGLVDETGYSNITYPPDSFYALSPLHDGYCLRSNCVKRRQRERVNDRGPLTDLWWDIHRLKHNSRRVDHPTQLPPRLMYRLISIFTKPGESVLDCFNGAGTTTLAAHQLGRQYIGIEKSEKYCELARSRHEEILRGINPFRKAKRKLTDKNSHVPRLPKRKYAVPKKTLQLEVRRVANKLGHLPNREELTKNGKYPIKYYNEYFVSWGEVCAAARTTGMTEEQPKFKQMKQENTEKQLSIWLDEVLD